MEEIKTHQSQPLNQSPSIRLKKAVNGSYAWEIFLSGEDIDDILKRIEAINKTMKEKYEEDF